LKCPRCGANVEVTVFDDGSVLIRQDCLCEDVGDAVIKSLGEA